MNKHKLLHAWHLEQNQEAQKSSGGTHSQGRTHPFALWEGHLLVQLMNGLSDWNNYELHRSRDIKITLKIKMYLLSSDKSSV